jgi:hypothetical protein
MARWMSEMTVPSFGDLVGGDEAAGGRQVLHDDDWIARDVLAEMAGRQPRQCIVTAPDCRTAKKRDLLASIKIRRRRLSPG